MMYVRTIVYTSSFIVHRSSLKLMFVADDAALVAELQAKPVGRWQVQRVLARYADFRTTQFLQSAAQPRP